MTIQLDANGNVIDHSTLYQPQVTINPPTIPFTNTRPAAVSPDQSKQIPFTNTRPATIPAYTQSVQVPESSTLIPILIIGTFLGTLMMRRCRTDF